MDPLNQILFDDKSFSDLLKEIHSNQNKKKNDQKVADAINTLFKRRENLEIFNKKALYIYIREMTDVDTPVITKVTKIMKKLYKELYNEFIETGDVRI